MQSKTSRLTVSSNKHLRKKLMSYLAAAALVSLGLAPSLQAQSAVPAKSIFRHLKLPFNIGTVEGIAATASDNVWAVNATKSLHFDGKSWSEQKLVPIGNDLLTMLGAATTGPDDAWAVGFFPSGGAFSQEAVEHFDGTKWSAVQDLNLVGKKIQNVVINSEFLTSVTALSPKDVWAAGWIASDTFILPFVEHFDGTNWSLVGNILNIPQINDEMLQGISAVSDTDVWAVGFFDENGRAGTADTFHFDGKKWTQIKTPPLFARFNAVTAIASNDVWAVGLELTNKFGTKSNTLAEHWDGKKWSVVPTPANQKGVLESELNAVAAVSSHSVWMVGDTFGAFQEGPVLHWDGQQIKNISPLPQPPPGFIATLLAVAAIPSGEVWPAGLALNSGPLVSWILFTDQGQ
jgi:hypothetical protein